MVGGARGEDGEDVTSEGLLWGLGEVDIGPSEPFFLLRPPVEKAVFTFGREGG